MDARKMKRTRVESLRSALWLRRDQMVWCAAFGLAVTALTGCVDGKAVDVRTTVKASVFSSDAGVSFKRENDSPAIIEANEKSGANYTFSWSLLSQPGSAQVLALYDCLDRQRSNWRFVDADSAVQPDFIRAGVKRCVESAGMPEPTVTQGQDSSDYSVELSAGNVNDSVMPQPGVPIYVSNGPFLGARRHIKTNAGSVAVAKDVAECRDHAVSEGEVFTTQRVSSSPDSAGWQMNSGFTTIQPMVDRFDQCLRGRGYVVESAKG